MEGAWFSTKYTAGISPSGVVPLAFSWFSITTEAAAADTHSWQRPSLGELALSPSAHGRTGTASQNLCPAAVDAVGGLVLWQGKECPITTLFCHLVEGWEALVNLFPVPSHSPSLPCPGGSSAQQSLHRQAVPVP